MDNMILTGTSTESADETIKAISSNSTLRTFTFISEIDNKIVGKVLDQLLEHKSLKELSFNATTLNEEAKTKLFNAVETNQAWDTLTFGPESLTDNNIITLAQALCTNTSLKALTLNNCCITDTGAMHLANALLQNFTLEKLSLIGNQISTSGILAFTRMLTYNKRLQLLNLQLNSTSEDCLNRFASVLIKNTSLYFFDLMIPAGNVPTYKTAWKYCTRNKGFINMKTKFETYLSQFRKNPDSEDTLNALNEISTFMHTFITDNKETLLPFIDKETLIPNPHFYFDCPADSKIDSLPPIIKESLVGYASNNGPTTTLLVAYKDLQKAIETTRDSAKESKTNSMQC